MLQWQQVSLLTIYAVVIASNCTYSLAMAIAIDDFLCMSCAKVYRYQRANEFIFGLLTGVVVKNKNSLILDVEVLSKRTIDTEKLHLNTLNLVGIDGEYLPGSNYYKNDSHYLFTNSLSNKLITSKKNLNKEENNNMNSTILPDNSVEDVTFTDINTEEAESFFDI